MDKIVELTRLWGQEIISAQEYRIKLLELIKELDDDGLDDLGYCILEFTE